jgi:hypothetical protein
MGQLEDMHIYQRVVETGSITKAAEQLNIAKSAVSKRLSFAFGNSSDLNSETLSM